MATKVSVTAGKGSGTFAECEISGGRDAALSSGDTFTDTVGVSGGAIQFLTVRRKGDGDISVKADDGSIVVEIDGGKGKNVSKGKTIKLPAKAKRVNVKEPVKR